MLTENKAKVKEVEKVVLKSVINKLLSLGFYKLYKGVRFLWFVFVGFFNIVLHVVEYFSCASIVSSLVRAH